MKLFNLTPKRRELLANFALNITVISFGVAAFEQNWWGIFPAFAGVGVFLIFTNKGV